MKENEWKSISNYNKLASVEEIKGKEVEIKKNETKRGNKREKKKEIRNFQFKTPVLFISMLSRVDTNERNMYIGSIVAGGKNDREIRCFWERLTFPWIIRERQVKGGKQDGVSKKCDVIGDGCATKVERWTWICN